MRQIRWIGVVCTSALFALLPAVVWAQASIAGTVKDSSGGVLPGVTVEASSPALIERVRTVITDSSGQYRVVDLRPGTYAVTFSLPGFNNVQRDGLVLAGTFTANIDAEMRVGSVEETIQVSGETPLVDVQNATQQRVLGHDVSDAIPSGRKHSDLAVLIPGMNVTGGIAFTPGNQDVGGTAGDNQVSMAIHGGKGSDQRLTQDGMSIGQASGATAAFTPNPNAAQEIVINTAATSAEAAEGGVRINFVPREGGNDFMGTIYLAYASETMQASNLDADLQARGLQIPNSMKLLYDVNPGFGGPLKRDKLWFYFTGRYNVVENWAGGITENATANDPLSLVFTPSPDKPAFTKGNWKDIQGRLTWQVTQQHKLAGSFQQQGKCVCPSIISAIRAPEASSDNRWPVQRVTSLVWTSPLTSNVLVEAGLLHQYLVNSFVDGTQYDLGLNRNSVPVTEQSTGMLFKMRPTFTQFRGGGGRYRASVSYITGTHALKVGFNDGWFSDNSATYLIQPIAYRVNNGIPNQITLNAFPRVNYPGEGQPTQSHWALDHELGLYVQDSWTVDRLTIAAGARFDWYKSYFPAQVWGETPLTPGRNIRFDEAPNYDFTDLTPRLAATYDLFGSGKTALKLTANKYLGGLANNRIGDPAQTIVSTTSRSWGDSNLDRIPQCDLLDPALNGECGPMQNPNFGRSVPSAATFNPATRTGFGNRPNNWEFSASVQHELVAGMSIDVGYFRRTYSNLTVVDNLALGPGDYDPYSVNAPANSALPKGGAYTVSGLLDLKQTAFGRPAQSYTTFASDYGDQIEHWNGVDASLSARLRGGVRLQGGVSSGRTTTDNCDVIDDLPELLFGVTDGFSGTIGTRSQAHCRVQQNFQTQVKGLGIYELPKVGVQVSGTYQTAPGPEIAANYTATNVAIAPSLGRNLAGNTQNATINLIHPGTVYGERLHQVDLRLSKPVTVSGVRASFNVDVYNLLNANTVMTESAAYATFRVPQIILPARFVKLGLQLDF